MLPALQAQPAPPPQQSQQQPPPSLTQILTTFSNEAVTHQSAFLQALANQRQCRGTDLDVAYFAGWYGLIGLLDAWSRFCRDIIIMSAVGGATTRTGTQLNRAKNLPAGVDPLVHIRSLWPSKGYGRCFEDGPYWHVPTNSAKAAQILAIGNEATVSGALLAQASAPTELRACRNYLAHRNPSTETHRDIQDLRTRISVPVATVHTEKLAEQLVTGGITLFQAWCSELQNIASAAIA
jgi:hypothetical protein